MDAKTEAAVLKLKKVRALSDILSSIDAATSNNAESIIETANIQFELLTEAILLLEG